MLQSRACLSFMRAVQKKIEPEKLFFLQSQAFLIFIRLVCKNIFLESENCFLQSRAFLSSYEQCGKNNLACWTSASKGGSSNPGGGLFGI